MVRFLLIALAFLSAPALARDARANVDALLAADRAFAAAAASAPTVADGLAPTTTCAATTSPGPTLPRAPVEDGVRVHRFPVGPREPRAARRAARGRRRAAAGLRRRAGVARNGVWSPAWRGSWRTSGHDLRVLAPYLFGTTLWGAQAAPERSALLPCLHDEPYAHLGPCGACVGAVRGCLFNAAARGAPRPAALPRARRRRRGHGLRPAAAPPTPPSAERARPRPLPRLRRPPRGGQARAGGGGARRALRRRARRTRRGWC